MPQAIQSCSQSAQAQNIEGDVEAVAQAPNVEVPQRLTKAAEGLRCRQGLKKPIVEVEKDAAVPKPRFPRNTIVHVV